MTEVKNHIVLSSFSLTSIISSIFIVEIFSDVFLMTGIPRDFRAIHQLVLRGGSPIVLS